MAAAIAPAATAAAGEGKAHAPQRAELEKCGQLRYLAKEKDKAVGPNVCTRGVRFRWASKDGKRHHWATRPATAREVAAEIQRLRAVLHPPTPARRGSSIPWYIVQCESGGSYTARNGVHYGRYQINVPLHYGQGGVCQGLDTSPAGQDECAARIWATSGPSAWTCA